MDRLVLGPRTFLVGVLLLGLVPTEIEVALGLDAHGLGGVDAVVGSRP